MAEFHFVEDYEKHVADLIQRFPLDEAMSLAVGGAYQQVGESHAELLTQNGLHDGMNIVDLGCGSGRTAVALSRRLSVEYDGYDIIQALLDYADNNTPSNYRFHLNRAITIPQENVTADYIYAFSLFTHLLHEETFIYMRDCYRVLRTGGTFLFSFLEFNSPNHWIVFERTVQNKERSKNLPLNMFMDRIQIETFAKKIGFKFNRFIDAGTAISSKHHIGQSVCVLKK